MEIARELKAYWSEVMAPGTKTVPECLSFLESLPLKASFKGARKVLLKPLSDTLVVTALEKLKRGSSPGVDGVPVELLMAFPAILVPKMTEMIQMFLIDGKISAKRALAILAPIPKEKGSISVTEIHPCVCGTSCLSGCQWFYISCSKTSSCTSPPQSKRASWEPIHFQPYLGGQGGLGSDGGRALCKH